MQGNDVTVANGSHEGQEPALQKKLKFDENSSEHVSEQQSNKHEANGQQIQVIVSDDDDDVSEDQQEAKTSMTEEKGQEDTTGEQKKKDQTVVSVFKTKKKNTNRCKLCKKGGTLSSFKGCKECGRLFHYDCIGVKKEEGQKKQYICDGCKEKQKQKRAVDREKEKKKKMKEKEKQLKLETVLGDAAAKKRPEKPRDKVKEEQQQLLEEFIQKYPQCIDDKKKFKFPIEDQLLRTYEKIIPDPILLAKRPVGVESKIIPQEFFGDILMIWSFVSQFSENLENINLTKEQLFVALDHSGKEAEPMLNHLFKTLAKYPLMDIYYTNKIDNHKELSDQPFFVASRFLKDFDQIDRVIDIIWPEFIRNLTYFQQYSLNFKDDELLDNALSMMKQSSFNGFYDLPTNLRIKFLTLLIACVDDSDSFHDGVIGQRQEKVHELAKERNDLQLEIKKEEVELFVLENKIKEMEAVQKAQTLESLESVSRAESLKKQREWEKEKKDIMRLQNQAHKMELGLNKKKSKVQQISYDLPHFINTSQFLGQDCEKSEFWLFHTDRKAIYIREKIEGNPEGKWVCLNTKKDIEDFILSLNKRGIRERNLFESLIYVTKNEYLSFSFEDLEKKAAAQITIAQAQSSGSAQLVGNCIQLSLGAGKNGLSLVDNKEENQTKDIIEEEVENEVKVNQQNDKEIEESVEESKEKALQFVLDYEQTVLKPSQTQANSTRSKRNLAQKSQGEKEKEEAFVLERARSTMQDVKEMILSTESMYTDYLARRKCRWANKKTREALKAKVRDTTDPREIQLILDQLNESFSAVDRMFIKENGKFTDGFNNNDEEESNKNNEDLEDNASACSDDEDYQGNKGKNSKAEKQQQSEQTPEEILESFENNINMRSKKIPMRIWGSYVEKVKKSWQNLLVENVMGSYLAVYIFCFLVQKFIQRKKEQLQIAQDQAEAAQQEEQRASKTNTLQGKRKTPQFIDLDGYKFYSNENFVRRSDRQRTKRPDMTEIDYDDEDFEDQEDDQNEEIILKKKKNEKKKNSRRSKYVNEDDEEEEEYQYDAENDEEEEEKEDEGEQDDEDNGSDNGDKMDVEENQKSRPQAGKVLKRVVRNNGQDKMKKIDNSEKYDQTEKQGKGKPKKNGNKTDDSDEEEFVYSKDKKNEKQKTQEANGSDKTTNSAQHINMKKKVAVDKEESEEDEPNSNSQNGDNEKDDWDEQCKKCGLFGELIMCDTCPSVFHLKCVSLKRIPSGEWKCPDCMRKSEQRHQKN